MKVVSTLADIEFRCGRIERRANRLVIHSHAEQSLKTTVYVAPRDVFATAARVLASPGAWLFIVGLPLFYVLDMLQSARKRTPSGGRGGWNTPDS